MSAHQGRRSFDDILMYITTAVFHVNSSAPHNVCLSARLQLHIPSRCTPLHITQHGRVGMCVKLGSPILKQTPQKQLPAAQKEAHALFMFIYTAPHILVAGSEHFRYSWLDNEEAQWRNTCRVEWHSVEARLSPGIQSSLIKKSPNLVISVKRAIHVGTALLFIHSN